MFKEAKQLDESSCPSWELLLRHVVQAGRLTHRQRELVVDHIARCERCADVYEALCDANAELWDQGAEAAGIAKREPVLARWPEEALADLWRRIDQDEAAGRRRRRAMVFRIGSIAAAACILIAVGIGWLALQNGNSGRPIPGAANIGGSSIAFAELVTDQGRRPLPLNQPVATDEQPQEILLGGMHRVVMNRDTTAVFAAVSTIGESGGTPGAPQNGHDQTVSYGVQLAQGELYVEVVPGHVFTVKTANARLDITGTKFDVRAEGDTTELTLLKGSVRFAVLDDSRQAVSVRAGYASTIAGKGNPSTPAPADAAARTAWAGQTILNNALARVAGQDVDLSALGRDLCGQPDLPDVDKLDYATWRDEHRQFSSAFTTLAAMRNIQIEADYIDLLMLGGDIWQFHYDPKLASIQPLTKAQPLAIARLARCFGLDERQMLRSVGLPNSTPIATSPDATSSVSGQAPGRQYAQALRRWHDALATAGQEEPEGNPDLKVFSLRASQYLADTRTAAYLWAKTHPQEARQLLADSSYRAMLPMTPAAADENEWLRQLRQQAVAARNCVPAAMEWLLVPAGTGCAPEASEQQRRLAALVAELVRPLSDQQEGKGQ